MDKERFSQSSNITVDEGRKCLIFVIRIKKSIDYYLIISTSLRNERFSKKTF